MLPGKHSHPASPVPCSGIQNSPVPRAAASSLGLLSSRYLSQGPKPDKVQCRTVCFSSLPPYYKPPLLQFCPLISFLRWGQSRGKAVSWSETPGWLLLLFSYLKALPLLKYLWSCAAVRFPVFCFYFWGIRCWIFKNICILNMGCNIKRKIYPSCDIFEWAENL